MESRSVAQAGVQWLDLGPLQYLRNLCLLGSSNSSAASQVAGTTGVYHQTWLIFVFLVEMGFTVLASLVLNSWRRDLLALPPKVLGL